MNAVELNIELDGGYLIEQNGIYTKIVYDYILEMTSDIIVLPIPNKLGYYFVGWYDNPEFNGEPIKKGYFWDLNKKTLYAKFIIAEQIWIGSNKNVIPNLNNGFHVYVFNNNYTPQFINLTLTATSQNGIFNYPEGTIIVKDQYGDIYEKFEFDGFENLAQNVEGSNSITVFLPSTGSYYIEVYFANDQVTSLTLKLSSIESWTEDLFLLDETMCTEISHFDSISKGDEIKMMTLKQAGRFNISIQGLPNASFVILKEWFKIEGEIFFEFVFIETIDYNYTKTFDLTEGIYYIGYFNATSGQSLSFSINRSVTQFNQNYIVADPAPGPCGTEVTLNGGLTGQNTITQGFTRLIYFVNNAPVNSLSRLDYYWYSSDINSAIITDYGTVLALNVTQDTPVKIMAVYKNDPSKAYIVEFIILKDTKTFAADPIIINFTMTLVAGTTGNSINFNSVLVPINLLQHYVWSSDDPLVNVDTWGRVYAYPAASGQTYTITGNYKFNSRVKIVITLIVV